MTTAVEVGHLRAELATAEEKNKLLRQQNRQLAAELAAIEAHVTKLLTYEADAKHAQRVAEFETQPCYRCDHPAGTPDDNCGCCGNGHLGFPEPGPED